ncbi:hypothetical protein HKM25_1136 [Streptococcus pneumoniae]|nr:hypothetical protein SP670_1091 [Streptococcus pneumoniae 670-6B]EGI85585.1 hypothetical protein SPAR148_1119 [Streptococcus pneumoniae GA17545]EHD64227.1 hypothetical protein SPAR72_1223 [Streptococcus pneumoniae GA41538]EHD87931.1 hypothetical protein SPAR22_0573 [Streptococcus pneumoniae GA11304]EHE01183.1 hypothetical protein SPAR39_1134 [Streptococcus pneumoniae GA16242]EHE62688.1 hypothetical protein SPAR141_1100 [Streptococcus pneumoniae NP112]EHZ09851.1 hypothetical protein SPAR8_0
MENGMSRLVKNGILSPLIQILCRFNNRNQFLKKVKSYI